MPGVEPFLLALLEQNLTRVVVTHSAKALVEALADKNPLLHTIPHWITREDYAMPKPAPDGYLRAIRDFSKPGDRIIGFEDSSRGLRSLMQTPATAILINGMDANLRKEAESLGVKTFTTFEGILNTPL
jgi:HAD superfamily hydrolase (TIGR01509 family)